MGALGMRDGDRIVYEIDGRHGVAGEFMQDGDVDVSFDNGTHETVNWSHCHRETPSEQPSYIYPLRRRGGSITAAEVLVWMRAQPGASWIASINDIEHAIDAMTK